jgi:arsenate reductase
MSTVKIYGIKNCDTMKKAMTWLEKHNIAFDFHDYKKSSIDQASLEIWLSKAPWDELINKRGTTWRKLPEESKENIDNEKAIQLMLSNTSLIKRPVLIVDDTLHLGFKEEAYNLIFTK